MQFFDPHIHMTSRTTDDYERMAAAGIRAVVEPAFWLGQPRTTVGSFEDYYRSLLGWEPFRASQFGIRHYCTMGLNPREANNPAVADGAIELVKRFMVKEGCVGIGEIGYDEMSEAEHRYFRLQLELGRDHGIPVLIHSPHRDKKNGIRKSIDLCRETGIPPRLVLLDHSVEDTTGMILDAGMWCGHSIYPNSKMTPERMVAIVKKFGCERVLFNSAADWGVSDPLLVPKTVDALRAAGIPEEEIERMAWRNPIDFFKQSGNLDEADLAGAASINQNRLFEGNSVLRGQAPIVR